MSNPFAADQAMTDQAVANISTSNRKHYVRPHPTRRFDDPEKEIREYAAKNSKKCSKCHKEKCLLLFAHNTSGRDAFDQDGYRLRRPECEDCKKSANKGLGVAKKIAKEQGIPYKAPEGTCCAVCKATDKLVFDHDHEREVFRGYLCNPCNRSMGVLGDSVEGLLRYVNYLNQTEQKNIKVSDEGELYVAEEE